MLGGDRNADWRIVDAEVVITMLPYAPVVMFTAGHASLPNRGCSSSSQAGSISSGSEVSMKALEPTHVTAALSGSEDSTDDDVAHCSGDGSTFSAVACT